MFLLFFPNSKKLPKNPPFRGIFLLSNFYFLAARKSANTHPTTVQPNKIDAHLIRILSYLSRSFTAAKYAGANIMHINTNIATARFTTNKMSASITIYMPYVASLPNSSSIRINWLYFAIRSVLDIEPVLI